MTLRASVLAVGILVAALGMAAVLFPAAALPPAVTVSEVLPDATGVEVRWQSSPGDLRFTLESREALDGAAWGPVPGGDWPATNRVFRDLRPVPGSRYFRVVAVPGPVERGRLLAATHKTRVPRSELQVLFTLLGFPIVAERDVVLYRVLYETPDAHGLRTQASGLLAVPVAPEGPLPMVSYQHGTVFDRNDVPSRLNLEGALGAAFASSGYVAVLPDYLGLGDSPGFHPYHHADSTATSVVDLLRAVRTLAASEGIPLDSRLFLTGYSQGGHATLAALREIEARHAGEFTVTACAAAAGAYDLSGVTTADFLSGRPRPNPAYLVYLLAAMREVYGIPNYLDEPYATTVSPLLDGTRDAAAINAVLPADPTLALAPGCGRRWLRTWPIRFAWSCAAMTCSTGPQGTVAALPLRRRHGGAGGERAGGTGCLCGARGRRGVRGSGASGRPHRLH